MERSATGGFFLPLLLGRKFGHTPPDAKCPLDLP
jgi:hypothetical protein